jgi:hypothetical protein
LSWPVKQDPLEKPPYIPDVRANPMKGLILILFTVCLLGCGDSRKRKFYAILSDDLSALHLELYDDNSFKLTANSWLSNETFSGQYNINGDTIIFLDPIYKNDFLPRELIKYGDKLIFRFNNDGSIDTGFASYFEIRQNDLIKN